MIRNNIVSLYGSKFYMKDQRSLLNEYEMKLYNEYYPNSYSEKYDLDKSIYLLDTIKKYKYTTVYVVESQINALTLWGWGYPSVALFGTGSEHQYNLLKKSGIRNFVLCFDGDTAGRQGAKKLVKTLPVSSMVTVVQLPESKDVNDLTKEEFERLPRFDRNDLKF